MSNTCAVPTVRTAPLCAMSMQHICIWAIHQQQRDTRAGNIFYNLNDTTAQGQQCCEAGFDAGMTSVWINKLSLIITATCASQVTQVVYTVKDFCLCSAVARFQLCVRWGLHDVPVKEGPLKWMCSSACTCAGPIVLGTSVSSSSF